MSAAPGPEPRPDSGPGEAAPAATRKPTARSGRAPRPAGTTAANGKARKSRRSRGKRADPPPGRPAASPAAPEIDGEPTPGEAAGPAPGGPAATFERTTITLPPSAPGDVSGDVPGDVPDDPDVSPDVPPRPQDVPPVPTDVLPSPTDVPDVLPTVPTAPPDNTPETRVVPRSVETVPGPLPLPDPLPLRDPLTGVTPPPPPYLAALTGLTLLVIPLAAAGAAGLFTTAGDALTARILAGCSGALDLLLVLSGTRLAWGARTTRKGLWGGGIGPLLAGLLAIGGAAYLDATDQPDPVGTGLSTLGRVLAGLGTGTLTVYWLRARTGSVRLPAHRPSLRDRARTSRSTPLLVLAGLVLGGIRPDVLTATYLLPGFLLSAALVVSLVRAPHSPLTIRLTRVGRRSLPAGRPGAAPLPTPDDIDLRDERPSTPANTYVARSGRLIDLDGIPPELRLLPLPTKAGPEGVGETVQTE